MKFYPVKIKKKCENDSHSINWVINHLIHNIMTKKNIQTRHTEFADRGMTLFRENRPVYNDDHMGTGIYINQ